VTAEASSETIGDLPKFWTHSECFESFKIAMNLVVSVELPNVSGFELSLQLDHAAGN
jgi:hypothetical protein